MALKYDAVVTGETAGLSRLWAVIDRLPNTFIPESVASFRMWGDRMSIDYASRADEMVKLRGSIFGRRERAAEVWPEISREFPNLTFRVTYHISDWHADTVEYRDGQGNTVEKWAGYFMACEPSSAPVHHWTVRGELDPDLLAPYLIPGSEYEHLPGEYPVRDVDGVRAVITARLGADSPRKWGTTAWTLDEDAYVTSVQTIHHPESHNRPELKPHVLDLLAAVQREVTLTQDEVSLLIHDARSSYIPELVQLENDLLDRAFNTGDPLHPTPNMIWHLLVRVASEERRIQIGVALKSPRWAGVNGRWPKWELLAKHRAETRDRPPESLPPLDMEAFTAELREIEARDPVQT